MPSPVSGRIEPSLHILPEAVFWNRVGTEPPDSTERAECAQWA